MAATVASDFQILPNGFDSHELARRGFTPQSALIVKCQATVFYISIVDTNGDYSEVSGYAHSDGFFWHDSGKQIEHAVEIVSAVFPLYMGGERNGDFSVNGQDGHWYIM